MEILDPGHSYIANNIKDSQDSGSLITFFKDPEINGDGYSGTSCQELLRVLIGELPLD